MDTRADEIRRFLTEEHLSPSWLRLQLNRRGIAVGGCALTTYLNGTRGGKNASIVINACVEIRNQYRSAMANENAAV